MNVSYLHRELARVLGMCKGTKVRPTACWGVSGDRRDSGYMPTFGNAADLYEFAVAILEDKPVFPGDIIYNKNNGRGYIVKPHDPIVQIDYSIFTWVKTFMLNDQELPCTVTDGKYAFQLGTFATYCFETQEDCNKVLNAINKLLQDATK